MDDLSLDDCDKCFSKISSRLIGCFPFTAGGVFLDGCFMRFDNYSFYEEIASEIYDVQRCSDTDAAANSKEYAFSEMVLIDNLVEKAPMNKGFADEETKMNGISVYGLLISSKFDNRLTLGSLRTSLRPFISKHCANDGVRIMLTTGQQNIKLLI
ncbi:putative cysteine-rich receptor-like protein kinase 43 [Camellia lanceoleosa]|uniref:Cysteine-rich receptor-like protein kinase 43 n=1 Tax=Camellia lanceoleosa TaxID=1840588 RepID=A0ACC0GEL2_9ERIC|nr:putative cysteine-rich receptor-like protein kinase 43 [Camellia lanceoleosa]